MCSCGSNPVGGVFVGVVLPLGWPGQLNDSSFQHIVIFVCSWADSLLGL